MTSKLPKYFSELVNFQRRMEILKRSGINDDDLMALADIRDDYTRWISNLKKEYEFNKFGSLFASNNTITDYVAHGGVGSVERYFEVKEILKKEVELRIEFFSRLELTPKPNKKILIKIDQDKKEVSTENNGKILKYPFRKSDGVSKRFQYLVMIAQNPKVGARKLSTTTFQNISSEISEININIKEALKLTRDLIVNVRNSGYQINDLYEIDFT